jgi:alpha-tubulin suppressor-like RCC1 family protein
MKPLHLLSLLFLCMAGAHAVEPQISAGRYQNMALDSDGAVYLWGASENPHHFRSTSLWQIENSPTKVAGLPSAIGIAAGRDEFAEVLGADGAIYEWGYGPIQNQKAKAGHPMWGVCELMNIGSGPGKGPCGMDAADFDAAFFMARPTRVKDVPPASAVVASNIDVLALTRNGEVYCWGIDAPAQRVPGLSDIVAISLGQDHGIALRKDGAVITWGRRALGLPPAPLQIDDHSLCDEPVSQVVFRDAIGVYATDQASYAWRKDGTLWAWGVLDEQAKGKRRKQIWEPEQIATIPGINDVAVTAGHWVARTADGKVYAKSSPKNARSAQDATTPDDSAPIAIKLPDTMAISAFGQTLTLTKDAYVCAWNGDINARAPVLMADGKTPLTLYTNRKELPGTLSNLCAPDQ